MLKHEPMFNHNFIEKHEMLWDSSRGDYQIAKDKNQFNYEHRKHSIHSIDGEHENRLLNEYSWSESFNNGNSMLKNIIFCQPEMKHQNSEDKFSIKLKKMNYKGGNSKFNPKINIPIRKNDGIINIKAINPNRNLNSRHMANDLSFNRRDSSNNLENERNDEDELFSLPVKSINSMKKVKSHSEPRRNIFNEEFNKRKFTSEYIKKNCDYQHPAIFQSKKLDK